jgi:hypothetical protein
MCGRRAPELPIDVAPRIGKARVVVDHRYSAVQTLVKCESIILMSRGELVWMRCEKLMLIFCWDAVSIIYSIHAYHCPSLVPSSLYSASVRQCQDRVPTLRIQTMPVHIGSRSSQCRRRSEISLNATLVTPDGHLTGWNLHDG